MRLRPSASALSLLLLLPLLPPAAAECDPDACRAYLDGTLEETRAYGFLQLNEARDLAGRFLLCVRPIYLDLPFGPVRTFGILRECGEFAGERAYREAREVAFRAGRMADETVQTFSP